MQSVGHWMQCRANKMLADCSLELEANLTSHYLRDHGLPTVKGESTEAGDGLPNICFGHNGLSLAPLWHPRGKP
jgi:hypothetical protein